MDYLSLQKFIHTLEQVTLGNFPKLKPDTQRLTRKLHAEKITQKEVITLVKRLKKAGHL